jgi:hypothetical protein
MLQKEQSISLTHTAEGVKYLTEACYRRSKVSHWGILQKKQSISLRQLQKEQSISLRHTAEEAKYLTEATAEGVKYLTGACYRRSKVSH